MDNDAMDPDTTLDDLREAATTPNSSTGPAHRSLSTTLFQPSSAMPLIAMRPGLGL